MIRFELPLTPTSSANLRQHWSARASRVRRERWEARITTQARSSAEFGARVRTYGATITLTRRGPRVLDDDNLAGAAKSIRDGIADGLGVDDGNPRLRWVYEQVLVPRGIRGGYAITIEAHQ